MMSTLSVSEAQERRRRPRLTLACPVRLFRIGYESRVETKTENISCEGFFCITESFFSPHEKLDCELVLTNEDTRPMVDEAIIIRCRAEVVRVERHNENSAFGVGCRFADYTLECQPLDQASALNPLPEPA
jgi:PilZ domain